MKGDVKGKPCCPAKSHPLRLTTFASSPKGTPYGNAGNFIATAKSRPLGEGGCDQREQTEGVLHPVKMQCRSVRRRSGIALL